MNWTGGSLSRSRKQNANLNVIQKKHFAKVRGQLLNGRPPPPRLDASILQGLQNGDDVHSPVASTSSRHHERQRSQMTLDEYENLRPVVRHLQSLKPRHAQRETPFPPIESQPPLPSAEPNRRSSTQLAQTKSHTQTNQYRGNWRSTNSDVGATEEPPAIDELEAKRRELLRTSDWVGLRTVKPLTIQFPDAEDRDLIGKRRRVDTDQNRAVGVNQAPTRSWRPVNAYEKLNMRRANLSMPSSPSRISIHIGSSGNSSSQKVRQDSCRRHESDHNARKSDEMLFDDQGSARAAIRNEGSTQGSFRQSEHASDEMLFDREWSGIASPLDVDPPTRATDSRQHPHHAGDQSPMAVHPTACTTSSGLDTEHSEESQHAGEVLCNSRNASAASVLHCSLPVAIEKPLEYPRTMLRDPRSESSIDHRRDSNNIDSSHGNKGDHLIEQIAPERTKRPPQTEKSIVVERPADQSRTAPQRKRTRERSFAEATAQELTEPFLFQEQSKETLPKDNHGGHPDRVNGIKKSGSIMKDNQSERNKRDQNLNQTEQAQHHVAKAQDQQFTPDQTLQRSVSPSRDPAPTTAKASTSPPDPAPTTMDPNLQAQPPASQPVDPTPEEDELIWRTFVFGTDNPNDDGWIFDRPAPKTDPPPLATQVESSSPIPTTTNLQDQTTNQSSPLQQTQPSLLAEASSSSANSARKPAPTSPLRSSSPTRGKPPPSLDLPPSLSSHTDPQPSTSPPKTQHSTQAQPATSSDELALSSSPARPAVLFRRPRRYVGDAASPMGAQPIRLGVMEKRKGRKRSHEGGEEGDEEAYGERLRGRKRRRGEWRREVREVMEGVGDEEGDEIVDD
ncbi:MAG: hypothetical protein Q9208_006539 [Pyrenodesmia sp. 3 TL-2023]